MFRCCNLIKLCKNNGGNLRYNVQPKRSYKIEFKRPTYDDLPVPKGSWAENYARENRKYNIHLLIGVGATLFTCYISYVYRFELLWTESPYKKKYFSEEAEGSVSGTGVESTSAKSVPQPSTTTKDATPSQKSEQEMHVVALPAVEDNPIVLEASSDVGPVSSLSVIESSKDSVIIIESSGLDSSKTTSD